MPRKAMGLCASRHIMPVDKFIYNEPVFRPGKAIDFKKIQSIADNAVFYCREGLDLYVTGCGPALGAVISACYGYRIPLTLYHWDKVSESYEPQVIFPEASVVLKQIQYAAEQLN